jgi:protein TonB
MIPKPEQKPLPAAASTSSSSAGSVTVAAHQTTDAVSTQGKEGAKEHSTGAATKDGAATEQAKTVYLREHFSYIRGIIMRNLIYPDHARRMGWSGKVVLCFTIEENGEVRDVKVHQGSGFPMLDRAAVEAVKRAAPLPRPPVRAEVMLPVTFRLS